MAQLINVPYETLLRSVCGLFACALVSGCSETNSRVDISGLPFIQVMYQGEPIGDVQVRLHQIQGGPVIAQSVSRLDGYAYFSQVPSPEPSRYFVSLDSISDGSWMLDSEACQKLSQQIALNPLESSPGQRIEIPDGAVHPISSIKRR